MVDQRIEAVVNNLSSLILDHAKLMASEQHAPSRTSDSSDEYIAEHKKWVKELREIRARFEDLVTGVV